MVKITNDYGKNIINKPLIYLQKGEIFIKHLHKSMIIGFIKLNDIVNNIVPLTTNFSIN